MTRAWLIAAALWMLPWTAAAQADGETLTEGAFNVDLVTGPVLGTGQITGLGGAYSALSNGIDGAAWNPAAYASRTLWGIAWFDWDLSLSVSPGTVGDVDFDNNGRSDAWRSDTTMDGSSDQRFQYAAVGLGLQFGAFGAGVLFRAETYNIDLPGDEGNTVIDLVTGHYGAAYHVWDGQLVIGAGLRSATLSISAPQGAVTGGMMQQQTDLVSFNGFGLETGVLLRLVGQPWRLGAAARTPVVSVIAPDAGPTQPVNGVSALPKEVRLPWEVQIGAAWQIGERPLNRRWENPHVARDELWAKLQERRRLRTETQWELEQREAGPTGQGTSTLDAMPDYDATWQSTDNETANAPARAEPASPQRAAQAQVHAPSDASWWVEERQRRSEEEAEYWRELRTAERRRELAVQSLSRNYVLLTGEVILVGPTVNGVSVESFLNGVRQTSGERVSVGFRAGLELEPIAHWLKLRGGGYLEPSRYPGHPYRAHGTLGFDVRLFTWDVFGLMEPFTLRTGATLDAAQRYTSFGINLGFWH